MKHFTWALLLIAGAASAQTVTLTASPSTGQRPVTPTLTWATTPAATSCTASGGWAGTKAASGTEVLPAILVNTSYTLSCSFGTAGTKTVVWTAPTTNTDGSPLTNLSGFRVLYGTSATSLDRAQTVASPTATTATINGLTAGTWYFMVRAYTPNSESDNSNIASAVVSTTTTRTANASITVTQPPTVPNPPTNLRFVDTVVFDIKRVGPYWYVDRHVASVKEGALPERRYAIGGQPGYCQVKREDTTQIKPSKGVLVARCTA